VTRIPRNKNPQDTRDKILDAAAKVFIEKGYEAATILDIVAEMAGLTRGAFYHHFKSKEEVFSALSDKIFEERNVFEMASKQEGLNGFQKLQLAIKLNLQDFDDEYRPLRMAGVAILNSPHFLAEHLFSNAAACKKYIQPLIEEGVADGSMQVANPRLAAELLVLLFSVWIPPIIYVGDDAYMEEKADMAIALLEHIGLKIFDEEFEKIGTQMLSNFSELRDGK